MEEQHDIAVQFDLITYLNSPKVMSNTGTFLHLICPIEKQKCTGLNFVKDGSRHFRNRKDVLALKHVVHIILLISLGNGKVSCLFSPYP